MLFKIFLAFTLIPALEIYLLMTIGGLIGALNTLAVIILTGFVGAYLARLEGLHTLMSIQRDLQQGIMPTEQLIDALIILVAGIVLLTPGFLTDAAGVLLLIPHLRAHIKRWLRRKFDQWTNTQNISFTQLS